MVELVMAQLDQPVPRLGIFPNRLYRAFPGIFNPEFHSQCRYAAAPIRDELPHYKGTPARFGGSDELMGGEGHTRLNTGIRRHLARLPQVGAKIVVSPAVQHLR